MKDLLKPSVERHYSRKAYLIFKNVITDKGNDKVNFDRETKKATAVLFANAFSIVERVCDGK